MTDQTAVIKQDFLKAEDVKTGTSELVQSIFDNGNNLTEFHAGFVGRHDGNTNSIGAVSFYGNHKGEVVCHNAHGPTENNPFGELINSIATSSKTIDATFAEIEMQHGTK